jgi:N-carbamoyl-L-amino-acid hydrolase
VTGEARLRSAADDAFLADFAELGAFGRTPAGGVDRQAASPADVAQREWFEALLVAHGLRVEYDRIGNQFGCWDRIAGAPYVVVGSHLDSQPTAGRFDGAYGVLAAAHAVFRLMESAEGFRFNVAVVNWFNEEGSRFAPSMMGSAVYTGRLAASDALAVADRTGETVENALARAGFLGTGTGPAMAAAAEIHVEQGRLLENAGTTIGLVTGSWAARKYRVTVVGEQAHSGATVMGDRRDALYGAARVVVAARDLADDYPDRLHTAVGQLEVAPNSPVVVASRVELLLDLRSADVSVLESADDRIRRRIADISQQADVEIELELTHAWDLDDYQAEGVALARRLAEELGLPHQQIRTVAGHDSINLKELAPTVMLFVPSVDGISHNERELTRDDDLLDGLALLTGVVRRLALGDLQASS